MPKHQRGAKVLLIPKLSAIYLYVIKHVFHFFLPNLFAMSRLTPPIKASQNCAKPIGLCIFLAFYLHISKKSCNFAADFKRMYYGSN